MSLHFITVQRDKESDPEFLNQPAKLPGVSRPIAIPLAVCGGHDVDTLVKLGERIHKEHGEIVRIERVIAVDTVAMFPKQAAAEDRWQPPFLQNVTHLCPVRDCPELANTGQLLCPGHMKLVPERARKRLQELAEGTDTRAWIDLAQQLVASINTEQKQKA